MTKSGIETTSCRGNVHDGHFIALATQGDPFSLAARRVQS